MEQIGQEEPTASVSPPGTAPRPGLPSASQVWVSEPPRLGALCGAPVQGGWISLGPPKAIRPQGNLHF